MFWQQFSTLSDKEEAARLLQWLTAEVRVLQQLHRPSSHDGLSGVLSLFGGGNPLAAGTASYPHILSTHPNNTSINTHIYPPYQTSPFTFPLNPLNQPSLSTLSLHQPSLSISSLSLHPPSPPSLSPSQPSLSLPLSLSLHPLSLSLHPLASAVPFHRYRDPWEVRVCNNNNNGSRYTHKLTCSITHNLLLLYFFFHARTLCRNNPPSCISLPSSYPPLFKLPPSSYPLPFSFVNSHLLSSALSSTSTSATGSSASVMSSSQEAQGYGSRERAKLGRYIYAPINTATSTSTTSSSSGGGGGSSHSGGSGPGSGAGPGAGLGLSHALLRPLFARLHHIAATATTSTYTTTATVSSTHKNTPISTSTTHHSSSGNTPCLFFAYLFVVLSTHPINLSSHHTLSTHAINPPSHPILTLTNPPFQQAHPTMLLLLPMSMSRHWAV